MASTNLIFLLDISGSMSMNGRLNQINDAIPDVLAAIAKRVNKLDVEAAVRVITFNNTAQYLIGSAEQGVSFEDAITAWNDLKAEGGTRTGQAFELAAQAMHTKNLTVSGNVDGIINAPVVILFTDGGCNGSYRQEFVEKLNRLKELRKTHSGRESILRIAIGVNDANNDELNEFASTWDTYVEGPNGDEVLEKDKKQVYRIADADDICYLLSNLAVSSVVSTSSSKTGEDGEVTYPPISTVGDKEKSISTSSSFPDFSSMTSIKQSISQSRSRINNSDFK